jgi:beta-glucosidase
VSDLLRRMTLDEKIGQMALISVQDVVGNCAGQFGPPQPNPACLRTFLDDDRVGNVLSGGGQAPIPNSPRQWALLTNAIQRFALEHSRLHIPILYGIDAVHGHNNVVGATIFPHNIGLAATWDPPLVVAVERSTARAVLATGIHWTFAPVADVARDLRWGRYYETFGEDPYLAAGLVAAAVEGFQGPNLSSRVAATAKHFLGYSQPLTGHDRVFAEISPRTLHQTFAPSFQAAMRGGVATVMAQSGSINGIPVTASHYLLTDLLRRQMGFKGVVVSDWGDVAALYSTYHLARSPRDAVRLGIMAGIDMSMVPFDATGFERDLRALVREGQVPPSRIDEAVRRILTLKFALGLFEHPYVDDRQANAVVLDADPRLARRAADETMTLLRNEGNLLPLRKNVRSILVAGADATDVAAQMGGWTVGWQGVPLGALPQERPPAVTVLEGIDEAVSRQTRVVYVPADAAQAARAARQANVAVVVVGEEPYAEGYGDTETAGLPVAEQQLVRAVVATGTPTVVVIMAGRPLVIGDLLPFTRALLMAYLPGTEGGHAVADVLFGAYNPSGRLAVSWPRTIGQVPLFYTYPPSTSFGPGSAYDPLFPFGYGLSYTRYTEEHLRVTSVVPRNGTITVSVDVTNAGHVAGDEIVQVYVHAEDIPILVPPRQLIGFTRIHLRPGATRAVRLAIPTSQLAVVPGDVDSTALPVVQAGRYMVMVGNQSATFTIR